MYVVPIGGFTIPPQELAFQDLCLVPQSVDQMEPLAKLLMNHNCQVEHKPRPFASCVHQICDYAEEVSPSILTLLCYFVSQGHSIKVSVEEDQPTESTN